MIQMKKGKLLLPFIPLLIAVDLRAQTTPAVADQTQVQTVQLESRLLNATVPYGVVLPAEYEAGSSREIRYPVVYLLHAYTGHYSSWLRRPEVVEWATRYRIIVVTPEGKVGWWTDSATVPSDRYETYLMKELIPDVDRRYRTVASRRGRSIAGFSMGGYGALKFAVKYPSQFVFAASFAGPVNLAFFTEATQKEPGAAERSIRETFGPPQSATRSANDLFGVLDRMPGSDVARIPYLYLACGDKDSLLESNRAFDRLLSRLKVPHEYQELSGGHDLAIYHDLIPRVIELAARKMVPHKRRPANTRQQLLTTRLGHFVSPHPSGKTFP